MRSRIAQVARIQTVLRSQIPCYRDPIDPAGGHVGRDGKVYPAGERWEWRRIALRREAVAVILQADPGASVRVVRDVLGRYGHRVSHEQARADIARVIAEPPGLVESPRWLSLEAWREETERRRRERTGRASTRSSVIAARRASPRAPRRPEAPARPQASVPTEAPGPGRQAERPDDWAVWNDPRPRR